MKILPHELTTYGYVLHEKMDIEQMPAFLQQHFRPNHWLVILYWFFNISIIGFIIYKIVLSDESFWELLGGLGLGIVFFVFLVIPHELIHAFCFTVFGAKNIVIKAIWRQMVFYAAAHHFVLDRKEFLVTASMPFLLINGTLILMYMILPSSISFFILGSLLIHTAGCSGDFALMSFMLKHKNMVTYDDLDKKISYFYKKQN